MYSEFLEAELSKITPVVNTSGSDSAMLDNTLGISGNEWTAIAACRHDDHSGAMDKQPGNESGAKRLLSILCNHDGAMGWTGIHSFLRWRYYGSSA